MLAVGPRAARLVVDCRLERDREHRLPLVFRLGGGGGGGGGLQGQSEAHIRRERRPAEAGPARTRARRGRGLRTVGARVARRGQRVRDESAQQPLLELLVLQ